MKVYKRLNDKENLYFGDNWCISYGASSLSIDNKNKLNSYINHDPFKVPKNSEGMHEITEELPDSKTDFKDYEVFAISTL